MFEVRKPACTLNKRLFGGRRTGNAQYICAFLRYYYAAFMPVFPIFSEIQAFYFGLPCGHTKHKYFLGELAK